MEKFRPGQYNLKRFIIITETNVIDIRNVFLEINLYEDLFSFSYSGNVAIIESDNLPGVEKILGGERILFDAELYNEVDGQIQKLDVSFLGFVSKISTEFVQATGTAKKYSIEFVSEQHVQNLKTRISKSFVKKPLHEIVKYCFNALQTEAPLTVENTQTTLEKVIIPNWTPFRAINWCAEKAIQTESRIGSSLSSFVFFQTLNESRFWFRSFDNLYKQPPKKEIYYFVKKTHSFDVDIRKYSTADTFEVLNNFDLIKLGMEGAYSSRLTEISVTEKRWKNTVFNYRDDFQKKFDSLNKNPFYNQYLNPFLDSTSMVLYMKSMELGSNVNMAKQVRTSQLSLLNNHRIKIRIPASPNLSVGDVVDFKYPDFRKDTSKTSGLDMTHSGLYLITGINHHFTSEKYMMVMELVKESIGGEEQ